LGEEAMAKMFPIIKVRRDVIGHVNADLLKMFYQLEQMQAYCERLIV
jgi:hypothetical protein